VAGNKLGKEQYGLVTPAIIHLLHKLLANKTPLKSFSFRFCKDDEITKTNGIRLKIYGDHSFN